MVEHAVLSNTFRAESAGLSACLLLEFLLRSVASTPFQDRSCRFSATSASFVGAVVNSIVRPFDFIGVDRDALFFAKIALDILVVRLVALVRRHAGITHEDRHTAEITLPLTNVSIPWPGTATAFGILYLRGILR